MFPSRVFTCNDQFQAIHVDICATILNLVTRAFKRMGLESNGTRSSLDGPFHGSFRKFLVNEKRLMSSLLLPNPQENTNHMYTTGQAQSTFNRPYYLY